MPVEFVIRAPFRGALAFAVPVDEADDVGRFPSPFRTAEHEGEGWLREVRVDGVGAGELVVERLDHQFGVVLLFKGQGHVCGVVSEGAEKDAVFRCRNI